MSPVEPMEIGDFTASRRMVYMGAIAVAIGVIATYAASALLALIALFTNIFYYQRISFAAASPADNTLGTATLAMPSVWSAGDTAANEKRW